MLGYDDVAIFLRVARLGSFVAAARSLGLPTSSVSRRVAALESRFSTQLLRRTTRAVSLTADGQAFADRCRAAMDELERSVRGEDRCNARLSGRLSVTAPRHVGNADFALHMLGFAALHPDLHLDLRLTDHTPELVGEGIDVAFQLGPLPDTRHVARKLWTAPYGVYAAPGLLAEQPLLRALDHPRQLSQLQAVVSPPMTAWRFVSRSGQELSVTPRMPGVSVDDVSLAVQAVQRGLGVGYLPEALAKDSPQLAQLDLGEWRAAERVFFAVYSASRQPSPKIRALVDHLLASSRVPGGPQAARV